MTVEVTVRRDGNRRPVRGLASNLPPLSRGIRLASPMKQQRTRVPG